LSTCFLVSFNLALAFSVWASTGMMTFSAIVILILFYNNATIA